MSIRPYDHTAKLIKEYGLRAGGHSRNTVFCALADKIDNLTDENIINSGRIAILEQQLNDLLTQPAKMLSLEAMLKRTKEAIISTAVDGTLWLHKDKVLELLENLIGDLK